MSLSWALTVDDVWAVNLRVTGTTTRGSVVSWLDADEADSARGMIVSSSQKSKHAIKIVPLPTRLTAGI